MKYWRIYFDDQINFVELLVSIQFKKKYQKEKKKTKLFLRLLNEITNDHHRHPAFILKKISKNK